jgi:opacity protein-like surface antigen
MRKTVLALTCFALAAVAANAQEDFRNTAIVSAIGAYQQDTNGNGIKQSAPEATGVLFTYQYFFTAHQGVEVNYGFSRLDETFSPTTSTALSGKTGVTSNTHEANASYVFRLPFGHRLTPFVSAGVGALVFSPTTSFSVNGVSGSTLATPDFVYSAGADLALSRRVSLRLGYRGHVFEAPDFGVSSLYTGSVAHMAEPFGGLSFHF